MLDFLCCSSSVRYSNSSVHSSHFKKVLFKMSVIILLLTMRAKAVSFAEAIDEPWTALICSANSSSLN